MDNNNNLMRYCFGMGFLILSSCAPVRNAVKEVDTAMPDKYIGIVDTSNLADITWREYFLDSLLVDMIDSALQHNQELNILLQEVDIAKNEIQARKGEYLPFVSLRSGAGIEKEGKYTRHGAVDEHVEYEQGKNLPDPLTDIMIGVYTSWELDI